MKTMKRLSKEEKDAAAASKPVFVVAARDRKTDVVTMLETFTTESEAYAAYEKLLDEVGFTGTHDVIFAVTESLESFLYIYPRFNKNRRR